MKAKRGAEKKPVARKTGAKRVILPKRKRVFVGNGAKLGVAPKDTMAWRDSLAGAYNPVLTCLTPTPIMGFSAACAYLGFSTAHDFACAVDEGKIAKPVRGNGSQPGEVSGDMLDSTSAWLREELDEYVRSLRNLCDEDRQAIAEEDAMEAAERNQAPAPVAAQDMGML